MACRVLVVLGHSPSPYRKKGTLTLLASTHETSRTIDRLARPHQGLLFPRSCPPCGTCATRVPRSSLHGLSYPYASQCPLSAQQGETTMVVQRAM